MLAFASIMLAFCKRAASELLRALARPGSFLIAASLIITLSAKAFVLPSASFNERWFTASSDIALHFFLLALFAGIERFGRRAGLLISALFGGAVFTLSILNFFYLTITKTQLQAHSLALGLSRAGETLSIAINHAETSTLSELFIILSASLIAFIALHFASRRLASSERDRTLPTIAFLALALISFAASPSASPQDGRLDLELLARSAHFETARTLPGLFKDDAPLIETTSGLTHFEIPLAVPAPSPPARPPNIFLIILESTRFDHVELPLEGHQSKARTPTIRKLAEEGAFFTRAYTPMPHTSKAIFAILCGRLPIMRQPIAEPFVAFHERLCLPQVLSERGYESAFFQTAIGAFERRPQLVERAGFDYFEAFETSDITPVGYLGGDDRELGRIITRWLEQREDPARPVLIAALTSSAHHPYELPPSAEKATAELGPRARYQRIVELLDDAIANIIEAAKTLDPELENTVIALAADHGEGLEGDPVHQHDNNFFENGLRVPVIVYGLKDFTGEKPGLFSLIDLAPTLLKQTKLASLAPSRDADLLGVPYADGARRHLSFACWIDNQCFGYIEGETKLVALPALATAYAYELFDNTEHRRSGPLTEDELAELNSLAGRLTLTIPKDDLLEVKETLVYGEYRCPERGTTCKHPSREAMIFHRSPLIDQGQ